VFARDVWNITLQHLDFMHLAPQHVVIRSSGWWKRAITAAAKEVRKGLNSLIILVAWEIWKHRNACVFRRKDHVYRKSLGLSDWRLAFGARSLQTPRAAI
jgi:hypothetical protein